MSDAKNKGDRSTFLKIESPSFSLELEGEPEFVHRCYDMVRDDILRRLTDIIRQHQQQAQPDATTTPAPAPSPREFKPRSNETFRSGAAARHNARDVKARMAARSEPKLAPAVPEAEKTHTLPTTSHARPNLSGKTKATLAIIPKLSSDRAQLPRPSAGQAKASPRPAHPSREGYVWVYITHEVYNKVYVAELDVFKRSPLGAFLQGERIEKLYLDDAAFPALRTLTGEGKTMWSELNPKAQKRFQRQNNKNKKP